MLKEKQPFIDAFCATTLPADTVVAVAANFIIQNHHGFQHDGRMELKVAKEYGRQVSAHVWNYVAYTYRVLKWKEHRGNGEFLKVAFAIGHQDFAPHFSV